MKKIDVAFVILHYLTMSETIKSVDYIKRNVDTKEYHVVIVDNYSSNKTGVSLLEYYGSDAEVSVILNEANEGYACGLNKGINFIRKKYDCFFIALMNNDIYLLEKFFVRKLQIEFARSGFAVLGPMILSGDGRCDTNPFRVAMPSKEDLENSIEYYKKILKNDKAYKYQWFLWKENVNNLLRKNNAKASEKKIKNFWDRQEGILIHGSIMILSPVYFEFFEGLDSNTFMYGEEYVLFLHLKEKKLTEIYNPDIIVMHAGSSSVNIQARQDAFDKRYYYVGQAVNSLAYVLEMMKGN